MGKPKIEYGYDFDGKRVGSVTFDLTADDVSEQIERFFNEHPEIEVGRNEDD